MKWIWRNDVDSMQQGRIGSSGGPFWNNGNEPFVLYGMWVIYRLAEWTLIFQEWFSSIDFLILLVILNYTAVLNWIGIVGGGGGVELCPLGNAGTNRLIVPAPSDYDGEIGGMMTGRGNRSTRRKPAPVPLCPPQTPHAARTRTRAAAVGSQKLTASSTARPLYSSIFRQ
jgi:hypothetical protein